MLPHDVIIHWHKVEMMTPSDMGIVYDEWCRRMDTSEESCERKNMPSCKKERRFQFCVDNLKLIARNNIIAQKNTGRYLSILQNVLIQVLSEFLS